MSDPILSETARTQAEVRRGWWPGWIWAIPIAALALVSWLALRGITSSGTDITIRFGKVYGLSATNTSVVYRGMKIGAVTGMALAKGNDGVDVTVHIKGSAAKFLTSGTRFWLRGAHPSLSNLSSLGAVLAGPTIVMQPGEGRKTTHFVGLTHRPILPAQHGKPLIYDIALKGAVGGLKPGEPVKLRGFTVGEIRTIGFRYDADTGALSTPVTIALYPSLFHIGSAGDPGSDAALRAAIRRLIREGLRARLERDPPLIGSERVALDIEKGAPRAPLHGAKDTLHIPAAPGDGLRSIVARLNKVPVDRIAQNLLDVTAQADKLVASPKLKDAIAQLDGTLARLRRTTKKTGPAITQLAERLRQTAGRLDDDAAAAGNTLSGLSGPSSQNSLRRTLREITAAARSVHALANYLDRHPEALIEGRSGG